MPGHAVLPFVAMLVAIALCPLWVPHWWERNRNKLLLSCALGRPVAGVYLVQRPTALLHTLEEYLSFILLLAALYAISGGIRLTGDREATPLTNTAFLAVGSVLASLIGTTGASVLLIRARLEINRERSRVIHTVVFFMFLVSNIGGLLTPIGDPPLLLSSFLDNAPTYLAFLALAQGLGLTNDVVGVSHEVLAAISVGAAFMGAKTYVGKAPNFMIKAMVEHSGVKMPTFLGYMGYSAAILLPLFVVLTFLLF